MSEDGSTTTKESASGQANPWKEMTTFEQVFLIVVLVLLVLFVVFVSVDWSWKAVGMVMLGVLLSRLPQSMLLQLALVAMLVLLFGWMLLSTS